MPFYIEDTIKEWEMLLGGSTPRDAAYFDKNKGVKAIIGIVIERSEYLIAFIYSIVVITFKILFANKAI